MLILVLLLRVFVVEAYIVPTGSMAGVLRGYHKSATCPQCGFPVTVGHLGRVSPEGLPEDERQARRHYQLACCSNCGWDELGLENVPECPGDRVMVHKHVFQLRPPRRWELVVFNHPLIDPIHAMPAGRRALPLGDAYIKRIVGLPGESVQIRDGDVFVDGSIARKGREEIRAMRVLVHDDAYAPKHADGLRWRLPVVEGSRLVADRQPVVDGRLADDEWSRTRYWLWYSHHTRQGVSGGKPAWHVDELRDTVGYNGGHDSGRLIHDLMLECDVEVQGNGWLDLAITDGHDDVLIHLPVGMQEGKLELRHAPAESWAANAGGLNARLAAVRQQRRISSDSVPPPRLSDGTTVHLEFGLVDRRAFLFINGVEAFPGGVDLPAVPANRPRRSLSRALVLEGHGPVSIGQRGLHVRARGLKLYRDVHYTDGDGRMPFPHAIRRPANLGPDEYFVLGDNSANSYDSRCWNTGPAIRHNWLIGKPFLLHLPTQMVEWNLLGEKRASALPDWNRMRLLR
jgi:signal peptidase I